MRHICFSSLVLAALCGLVMAEDSSRPDSALLQKKLSDLEQKLETVLQELREVRALMGPVDSKPSRIMTPQEAHDAFRVNPRGKVTVEFGVLPRGAITQEELSKEPIHVTWDCSLEDHTQFEVVLTPAAFNSLKLPNKDRMSPPIKPRAGQERDMVLKHIEENGLRVTGVLESNGRTMIVSSPANVVLYLTRQPGSEVYWLPDQPN
jgi:hypothetical protein